MAADPRLLRDQRARRGNVLAAAGRLPGALHVERRGLWPRAGEEQPISEQRPVSPRTPYALTKAAAERLALATGATVVRSFNLIGAGQAPSFALPSFAAQLAAIERGAAPLLSVGNLSARRDFVHVDDAVMALVRLAEAPQPGEIFNLASGRDHSIAELLERLIALSGLEVRCARGPGEVAAGRCAASVRRCLAPARTRLGAGTGRRGGAPGPLRRGAGEPDRAAANAAARQAG